MWYEFTAYIFDELLVQNLAVIQFFNIFTNKLPFLQSII